MNKKLNEIKKMFAVLDNRMAIHTNKKGKITYPIFKKIIEKNIKDYQCDDVWTNYEVSEDGEEIKTWFWNAKRKADIHKVHGKGLDRFFCFPRTETDKYIVIVRF